MQGCNNYQGLPEAANTFYWINSLYLPLSVKCISDKVGERG